MKIAIIDMDSLKNPFWAAGQARATREIAKRFSVNHEVTVYTSKYPGYKNYIEDRIRYVHVGICSSNSKLVNLAFILNIPFLARTIKADIILENFNAPVSISFAPLFTKIPVIGLPTMFHAEEFARKYHLPFDLVERLGFKFYKYLLPYSDIERKKAQKLNKKIKYKIVPQGVGEEFFNIKRSKPKHILFLGRFDMDQKGIDLLLKAYQKALPRMKLPLVIAGHGPDREKIEKIIKELKLEQKVKIIGSAYGKKKDRLLSEALFVAFSSRHEGFSLFSLEALASGLPLVAFDIPGLSWADEKSVLKAKPFDIEEYSKLLFKASNPSLHEKMSANSRELAKKYSWESVASQFEDFFYFVIEREKRISV